MEYHVGSHRLLEEIIQGIEFQEEGKVVVWYDYDGETRQCWTKSPFDRDDLRALLKAHPELEHKQESATAPQDQETAVTSVISPTVAINVQDERYFLAVDIGKSMTAFHLLRKERGSKAALPTTQEVMLWELRRYNAREQRDGSWSLPPRVTVDILEEILSFDIVKSRPTEPDADPLIDGWQDYLKHSTIY